MLGSGRCGGAARGSTGRRAAGGRERGTRRRLPPRGRGPPSGAARRPAPGLRARLPLRPASGPAGCRGSPLPQGGRRRLGSARRCESVGRLLGKLRGAEKAMRVCCEYLLWDQRGVCVCVKGRTELSWSFPRLFSVVPGDALLLQSHRGALWPQCLLAHLSHSCWSTAPAGPPLPEFQIKQKGLKILRLWPREKKTSVCG